MNMLDRFDTFLTNFRGFLKQTMPEKINKQLLLKSFVYTIVPFSATVFYLENTLYRVPWVGSMHLYKQIDQESTLLLLLSRPIFPLTRKIFCEL